MRRNHNLELRLFPLFDSHHPPMMKEDANASPLQQHHHHHRQHPHQQHQHQYQQNHQQPLTIFYDGKICVCDVTEFQARSILMLASRETEERVKTPSGSSSEPSSPLLQSKHNNNLSSSGTGLSMKRSLQRFLQKRKNRVQEASPYHH